MVVGQKVTSMEGVSQGGAVREDVMCTMSIAEAAQRRQQQRLHNAGNSRRCTTPATVGAAQHRQQQTLHDAGNSSKVMCGMAGVCEKDPPRRFLTRNWCSANWQD